MYDPEQCKSNFSPYFLRYFDFDLEVKKKDKKVRIKNIKGGWQFVCECVRPSLPSEREENISVGSLANKEDFNLPD